MPDEEKNHGIWKNRPCVQRAFSCDSQHAYNCVAQILTLEQAEKFEAMLCAPTNAAMRADLGLMRDMLVDYGLSTDEVDKKLAELSD